MKKMFQAAVVAAAVLAVPAMSLAQTPAPAPTTTPATKAAKPAKTATPAVHSATGTIKSVDASSLVITEKGNKTLTFALDNATTKEGDMAVGGTVTVKYHTDGTTHIATDVKAAAAKAAKAPKK